MVDTTDDIDNTRKKVSSGAIQHESQTTLPAVILEIPDISTNIDTQVEKRRNNSRQQAGNTKWPKLTTLQIIPNSSNNLSRFKLPMVIRPPRPARPKPSNLMQPQDKLLTHPRPKIRKVTHQGPGRSSKHTPALLSSRGNDENLTENSFLEGENNENLKGLSNAQELDKKDRKYLFDIVLTSIHSLRWVDVEDAT